MAIIKKSWGSPVTLISDGISDTAILTNDVDLETDGHEGAHVTVAVDFITNSDLTVEIQGSLDGVNFDDTPLSGLSIDDTHDPNQVSFVVRDVAHFRLKLLSGMAGFADTVVTYQPWRHESV